MRIYECWGEPSLEKISISLRNKMKLELPKKYPIAMSLKSKVSTNNILVDVPFPATNQDN